MKKLIKNNKIIPYIIFSICFLGCYGTESVNIKIKVDSKVDITKYKSLAVIDFFDEKAKSNDEFGKIIARMIRKQLKNNNSVQVLDEKDTILDVDINKNEIEDTKTLASIGNQLGVDALIVGKFNFYSQYQSVPYILNRYSTVTDKYTPEAGSYVQKMYRLEFYAKLVDGKTGEKVFDFSKTSDERPDYNEGLNLPFTDGTSEPANLRSVAVKSVKNFILSLVPHYENQRRMLAK